MIILAAAIILALNSSNLTSKANWAKVSSDRANLQAEYVSVLAKAMSDKVDGKASMVTVTELKATPEYQAWAQKVTDAGFTVEEPEDDNDPAAIRVVAKLSEAQLTAYGLEYDEANNEVVGYNWVINRDYKPIVKVDGVTIPEGFVASIYEDEDTVEEGLVIYKTDSLKGVNQETAMSTYDQFVWVPVPDMNDFVRTTWSNNAPTNTISSYSTEPSSYNGSTAYQYATEVAEYNAMKSSVEKHNGFYIARYEAGDGNATSERTTYVTSTVVSRKGAYVYNYVLWGNGMTDVESDVIRYGINSGKGAVYLSQTMYPVNENYTTNLIYGVQWDATLRYISDKYNVTDSSSWGNHSNSQGEAATNSGSSNMNYTTGRSEAWKAKNIYDLAGNLYEWTMEASGSSRRVIRGSSFGEQGTYYPVSCRGAGDPVSPADGAPEFDANRLGFRVALYLI